MHLCNRAVEDIKTSVTFHARSHAHTHVTGFVVCRIVRAHVHTCTARTQWNFSAANVSHIM